MHIQEAYHIIREDLKQVELEFRRNLESEVVLIRKVGEYILSNGGKRLRPTLLLLSARLCGYQGRRHIPLAAVVEFIHTATLLHDDVIDNASMRRGKASTNILWGNGASILIGDFLFSKSFYLTVADGDLSILKVLSGTTTRMAEGEVLQLLKGCDVEATEKDYLSVITNKTASLISAACQIGAILGKITKNKETALADYGMNLGIAFQLMDDCLDYTSSNEELGKVIGNDLREGKITLPLIFAIKNAVPAEMEDILEALESDKLQDAQLSSVVSLINKYRGIDYTLNMARKYVENAKACLNIFEPSLEKTALIALTDYVVERTY
ncbi:MAG: octaprenyl diphosphate synthase [Deltaproteobacteria bacterium GWC2_42_51]|nr:MAG: octaprenyl diphosphate synthase [Deltaproteobacteria bacterium GWA2_42_85]OGP31117.1 MAG: octaprenyl diphosphate synthase [Deltaproteobacteria bacterium GWC2_42_51]OGP38629.1 MAG: octaprenyl diphosphate synthase [Deltaproteobacteria bacterium GWD2_42_10]OGP48779.1 MAG: octaprenyl diphosphate synthase [Deltaproteobacteria bacterium GWF2_42_12]OGQ28905.1 MAG: octaprenyl diphosphate synthase [Deltaproteobacteria bacterium RIFCSPHIGHO2_02_FULL_42_44]OGQ37442.1 MAG: octaprenyl diphosphate s